MKCAYCGKEAKGTREHIISCAVLDLFPECYITFDDARHTSHESDPMVKDVCADCNNNKISYIDSYAKDFISRYFRQKYNEDDCVEVEYDYVMIQKMLLKYAYNDLRSHKWDTSFFEQEIIHYLMDIEDNIPKENVTVLAGLAVNVSPVPDAMFGNLRVSYLFKFNSVQFLLLCWDKSSDKIEQNNIVLECQYPYCMLKAGNTTVTLAKCTDEFNYHHFEHIHVRWDGLFEVGVMRKYASGGNFKYKDEYEKKWDEEEQKIIDEHPRGKR